MYVCGEESKTDKQVESEKAKSDREIETETETQIKEKNIGNNGAMWCGRTDKNGNWC